MHYRTKVIEETFGGKRFKFSCLENFEQTVDELLEELTAHGATDIPSQIAPYFGVLWPSARVLIEWILEHHTELRSTAVVELGCGLAIPSLVASSIGARVIATDQHPGVPVLLARNLALNPGLNFAYKTVDWKNPVRLPPARWIIASDVLYEKNQPALLLNALAQTADSNSEIVVVDPGRTHWPVFVEGARNEGWEVSVESRDSTFRIIRCWGIRTTTRLRR